MAGTGGNWGVPAHDHRPAREIKVAGFSILLQWPLILAEAGRGPGLRDRMDAALRRTAADLRGGGWVETDGLTMLAGPGETPEKAAEAAADGAYGEFVYFHDFLQDVLYPRKGKDAVRIFRHDGFTHLSARLKHGGKSIWLRFRLRRRTIHLFETGCAMVTIELEREPGLRQLTLDQAQTALDHLRRSYAPFFKGDRPGRCPEEVHLTKAGGEVVPCAVEGREKVMAAWRKARETAERDVRVFDHWRKLIEPLRLLSEEGGVWRDPSDERIPVNSFVRLASGGNDQAALEQIAESDWVRIADAEEGSTGDDPETNWPYNRAFAGKAFGEVFYDRFAPDPASIYCTSRHIVTGAHYGIVGAGWYVENFLHDHFRRHYTQMSLLARFELASLLAISSRLTRAVEGLKRGHRDRAMFNAEVLEIQDLFLSFVHRFRFTGVSGQVQPSELFAMWRRALGLDVLFQEVREELETAVASVRARQAEEEARQAKFLNQIAFGLGGVSVVLAGLGVMGHLAPLVPALGWVPETGRRLDDLVFVAVFVLVPALLAGAVMQVKGWPQKAALLAFAALLFVMATNGLRS